MTKKKILELKNTISEIEKTKTKTIVQSGITEGIISDLEDRSLETIPTEV